MDSKMMGKMIGAAVIAYVIYMVWIRDESSSGPVEGATASTWSCKTDDGTVVRDVTIGWGHTPTDAQWACNQWVPECKEDTTGCDVVFKSSTK